MFEQEVSALTLLWPCVSTSHVRQCEVLFVCVMNLSSLPVNEEMKGTRAVLTLGMELHLHCQDQHISASAQLIWAVPAAVLIFVWPAVDLAHRASCKQVGLP